MIRENNPWTDKDVEKHWDAVASIYVDANNDVQETHVQRFVKSIDYLQLADNLSILNITSRDAEADDFIRKANPNVSVIHAEISRGLMNVAQELRPHIQQVKLDTYSQLPFENNSFDRILTLETLEHVAQPVAFLSELNRVSKNGAIMVLSCPPATSEPSYRIYTFLFGGHGEGPHRFLPSKEVKELLDKTGWELKKHEGTLLVPVGPRIIRKWGEKLIERFQNTFLSELGIRQFYVCRKK